jgi:hypothetical protein
VRDVEVHCADLFRISKEVGCKYRYSGVVDRIDYGCVCVCVDLSFDVLDVLQVMKNIGSYTHSR